ncbi:MAG: hypothetical protein IKP19_08525 [Oscillospiraceae bacterium]|nr:hypothetical protein [Oscillospiraceae bacterium]
MKKQKKGSSVQELLGIKTFTRYGLSTTSGELVFYLVSPTNISVLSSTNIEIKVRHLMMVLSAHPDIEIVCTDSRECFDDNKAFLVGRLHEEQNPQVRKLLKKDVDFLDHAQAEMSTARQFLFLMRCRNLKPEQVFEASNRVEKTISEQGFEVRRMKKDEIKRFLAIFFEASMSGDAMPDSDGEQYFEQEEDDA